MNTSYFHKVNKLWLFIMVLILATSCATRIEDPLADHSFLTNQPCSAPCWYRLELNESDERAIYNALSQLSFIDQSTIRQTQFSWLGDPNAKEIYYSCTHPNEAKCGGARLSKGKLKLLYLSVGYELTFRKAVDKLGVPDYVDYGPYHPDVGGCQVELSWPEQGISIRSLNVNNDMQCRNIKNGANIDPETLVDTVFYSAKELFESEPGACCTRIAWPGFAKQ